MSLKILFLLSAPHQDLSLDEEYRTIEKAIERNSNKNEIELIVKLSTRIEDLIETLNQEQPHIVHFSGHGNNKGELIFTGDHIESSPISPSVMATLFHIAKDSVRLVFLDACHSLIQAQSLSKEIDYVIGMDGFICETTATTFASIFYASFSSNKTVEEAFKQAKVVLEIKHNHEKEIPKLLIKNQESKAFTLSSVIKKNSKKSKKVTNIVKGNLYGVQYIEKGGKASFRFEK